MAGTRTNTEASAAVDTALARAFGVGELQLDDPAVVTVGAGEALCDVGDAATTAWVVVSGRLLVSTAEAAGTRRTIGMAGPGELLGETALIDGGRRRARVRALRRSRLVELDHQWLADLVARQPQAAMTLLRSVTERATQPFTPPANVMAVLPLSPGSTTEARLVAQEAAATSGFPLLAEADVQQLVDDPSSGTWLDDVEDEHGGAVLLTDPTADEWTTTAAELADRILFVADVEVGPEISELEHAVLRSVPRTANAVRLLLLVHPAGTERPRATRAWIDRREVDLHLHLRRSTPAHRSRAARHLLGRPLALAVGAGGVRSAGAVGTVRALSSRGVAVDAAGGVSGGAIIAAWLALADDSPDVLEQCAEWSMRNLLDFTIPVGSVVSGRRAWSRIQEAVGDRDIADTWVPLTVVSTDLTAGRAVSHTRGPLADVLYASISIPGVFPPVDIDGHLHVDGALFDAIPVDGLRRLVPDARLVAVDLTPPSGRSTPPLPRVMPGGRLLLRRLIPGVSAVPVPSPLDTLMRSTTVASAQRRVDALGSVDCHVHLDLSEFRVLEFDQVRRVVALGEAQSQGAVDRFLGGDDPPLLDPVLVEAGERPPPDLALDPTEDGGRFSRASVWASLVLAWADLRFRARRFAVAGLASSVVLALLLQMTGVVNQLHREPRVTVDAFGGSSWIVPADADGAFTSNATFPEATVAELAGGRVLLARYRLADGAGDGDLDVVLVGHDSLPDGAPDLADGRLARGAGEVVLSDAASFGVGEEVLLGTSPAEVVGIVDGATVFAGMPLVFVPLEVARELVVGGEALISALVADEAADLPDSLHALAARVVAEDALGPVERPVTTLRLVQILLAVVAALIIGAVVFLATLDRLRDIAVVRAMGVRSGVISLGVVAQSIGVGLVAGVAALIIQTFLAPFFPLDIHLGSGDRVLLVAVAVVVAAAASYGAIRRTLRIDPGDAFGGPGA